MAVLLLRILRCSWILPVYPALPLIFLYQDVFILRESVATHDAINYYGAFNYFILALAQGQLPLWDPFSMGGQPFYLNINVMAALDPTILMAVPLIRYANMSALDVYHLHLLARLMIIYWGAYAFFRYIARNDWAALFSATIFLFILTPNTFWQVYPTFVVTYLPWISLFLFQMLSPETPDKARGWNFMAVCYLVGLSFNIYYPSFLYYYLSLILVYWVATRFSGLRHALANIGVTKYMVGLLVFFVMAAPFIFTLAKILPSSGEVFSSQRFTYQNSIWSDVMAHTARISLAKNPPQYGLFHHNYMAALLPGTDTRFFIPQNEVGYAEIFLSFGIVPLVVICVFFKRTVSLYKGLLLFLLILLCLLMKWPDATWLNSWLHTILFRYYPGLGSITQRHVFFAIALFVFCSINSICTAKALEAIKHENNRKPPSPYWIAVLASAHIWVIFKYLSWLTQSETLEFITPVFRLNVQETIFNHGWFLVVIYVLSGLFLLVRSCVVRRNVALVLALLVFCQLILFNISLKAFVLQPGNAVRTGYVFYNQPFAYKPVRIPFVPRLTTFWQHITSMYQIPTATQPFYTEFNIIERRSFDFVRFVSPARQKIVSGIGKRRFGFFDKYTIARDSVHALKAVSLMPAARLRDTLVLEEDPKELESNFSGMDFENIDDFVPDSTPLVVGSYQVAELYDHEGYVDFKEGGIQKPDKFLSISLPLGHSALDWPWDTDHIGYYQVMFGPIRTSDNYRFLGYYPNPTLRFGYDKNLSCYSDFVEWLLKHSLPGFYPNLYKQTPYICDIQKEGDKLRISPELQGAFVTNDLPDSRMEKNRAIHGFTVVSLDPALVTPDISPYGRDVPTEVSKFGPNTIQFTIHNNKPGLFYYADSYAEDWKAKLDGKPVHIYHADFSYKAVFVPAGDHTLYLEYNPWPYTVSVWIFLALSIPGMVFPVISLIKTS